MIGRSFIVKNAETSTMQHISPENSLQRNYQTLEMISLSYDVSDHVYTKLKIHI